MLRQKRVLGIVRTFDTRKEQDSPHILHRILVEELQLEGTSVCTNLLQVDLLNHVVRRHFLAEFVWNHHEVLGNYASPSFNLS